MSVPQLSAAFSDLNVAREKYDNLSGICATLQGLVLLEVKRKLEHGKYGPWLKEHFPKSQDVAGRFVRIAEDFIRRLQTKNTPESKFRVNAEFDASQLLLGDLASNLATIENAKLDMAHPIVRAAAIYAGKRSYTQLWLDLGPTPLGGDHRARDEQGELLPRIRRTHDEKEFDDALAEAMDWYEFGFLGLRESYLHEGARWQVLPEVEMANVADLAKLWAKKLDDICRARKIVPSKLRDWDKNLTAKSPALLEGGK